MSTPYYVIDNSFLNKISDYYLLDMEDEDAQELIDGYRNSASVKFKKCKKLLNKDDELRQYNDTLTDEEIEILSNLMVLEWLKPQINSMDLLKQSMSTKDYTIYSQANHLEALMQLKKDIKAEVDKLIISYTFSNNSLDDLRKKRP